MTASTAIAVIWPSISGGAGCFLKAIQTSSNAEESSILKSRRRIIRNRPTFRQLSNAKTSTNSFPKTDFRATSNCYRSTSTETITGCGTLLNPIYHGASVIAMNKLAQKKGYRLVAASDLGINQVFLRNDLAVDEIPAIDPASTLWHPQTIAGFQSFEVIKDWDYLEG